FPRAMHGFSRNRPGAQGGDTWRHLRRHASAGPPASERYSRACSRGIRRTMSGCAIVPAYDAARTGGEGVRSLVRLWPEPHAVIVVDDGSRDATAQEAEEAGAIVLKHATNRGKGAALRTGMWFAHEHGFEVAVTVDADGQHPPAEALRLLRWDAPEGAL